MYPENLLYTSEHEWVLIEGNTATVGITHFAQSSLGDIVYIDINTLEQSLQKDQIFGTVEAVKTVSDLFMPMSGKIVELNSELNNAPDLVNSDPYGKGWLIKIELQNAQEAESLLNSDAYQAIL